MLVLFIFTGLYFVERQGCLFHAWLNKNRVGLRWMRHGNQVQWTQFPHMETEFIELDFCVYKPSSMNSVSIHGNRVR